MKTVKSLLLASLVIGATPAHAQEDKAVRCVSLNSIQEVEVLDRNRILFRMNGDKNYLNTLPHSCPGLRYHQPFMYRTSTSELCDVDVITVLDQGGFGLRPQGSCGLGVFNPISDAEIDTLKSTLKKS